MKGRLHFVTFDVEQECWISQGLWALEQYLAKVARFQELHGA